jgi:hypothetical protein
MRTRNSVKKGARWVAAGAAVAAGAYAAYASVTWWKYGKPAKPVADEHDELLDRFMPAYEVVERHHVYVNASAGVTLATARALDVMANPIARAVFKTRALVLGGTTDKRQLPRPLAEQMEAIGWRVLAELPDKEIVFGAVTKPWEAEPEFRGVAPAEFAAFTEPGYVKIVWTLRADAIGESASVFRTETRVATTDAMARARFRRYWAFAAPGVAVIRSLMLGPVKCQAERRAGKAQSEEVRFLA